jgi:glycosyltransferase involved in cell wall biosynthesis
MGPIAAPTAEALQTRSGGMRISIALCTYNGEHYLQKQLDSFAAQSLLPCELVVCDDGSTDGTLELLGKFAEKAVFSVHLFRNERNLGSTKNFERAMGLCSGDLIALSDQDDEWHSDKLAIMHRLFEEHPQALAAFTDAELIDDNSVPSGRRLWKSLFFTPSRQAGVDAGLVFALLKYDYIATGATMVFRSELCREVIPIPECWTHDAWISWIAALRGGLAAVPVSTIRYRVHRRQQIGVAPASLIGRIAVIREKNAALYQLISMRLKVLRQYLEMRRDDHQMEKYIPVLEEKIRHLEGRAAADKNEFHRLCWVLSQWRNYRRFARGTVAMVADAFFVGRMGGQK